MGTGAQAEAGAQLFTNYYVPIFVKTCAERGLPVVTEAELIEHIKDAHLLREYESTNNSNILKTASATLRDNLTPGWREAETRQAASMHATKSASSLLGSNPNLRAASKRILGLGGV